MQGVKKENMEQQIYSEKIQKIISNVGLVNNGKYAPEPNIGYRFPIKSTKFKDTLWIRIERNQFVVGLSGNKNEDGHKEVYQYIGRDYDRQDTQSKEWQFIESKFNKIESIINCYAGVKKNMEIEFYPNDEEEFKSVCFESGEVYYACYNDDGFIVNKKLARVTTLWQQTVKNNIETNTIDGVEIRNIDDITKVRVFASNDFLQEKGKFYEKVIFADKFYFEEIKPLWKDFLTFEIDNIGGFIEEIKKAWSTLKGSYKSIQLQAYFEDEDKSSIIQLLNKIIAIIDKNAAKKKELNPYDDKRVIADSNVRQDAWIYGLLNYKDNKTPSSSIKNAISYIENPNNNMSVFSKEHRVLISKNILKATYNEESFVSGLKQYFNENEVYIKTECQENQTLLMTRLLYRRLKDKWTGLADTPTIDVEDDTEYRSNQPLNQILYGSPGTGKTRKAKEIAYNLITGKVLSDNDEERKNQLNELDENQYKLIQFHPAYSYEDFVRGIVAKTTDKGVMYETQNKVLAEIAENALNNHDEKFVLIIDEINRANLPAVLGELIYALEYRGEAVESMYAIDGDRKIILPENLYIIGTMNTADRSVGHIDYAIRRRFAFIDVKTDEGVIPENAKLLFSKIESLFNEHLSDEFAKDDVMIGHSYFLNDDLEMALEYEIKPILYEYVKDGVLTCEKDKITELNTV